MPNNDLHSMDTHAAMTKLPDSEASKARLALSHDSLSAKPTNQQVADVITHVMSRMLHQGETEFSQSDFDKARHHDPYFADKKAEAEIIDKNFKALTYLSETDGGNINLNTVDCLRLMSADTIKAVRGSTDTNTMAMLNAANQDQLNLIEKGVAVAAVVGVVDWILFPEFHLGWIPRSLVVSPALGLEMATKMKDNKTLGMVGAMAMTTLLPETLLGGMVGPAFSHFSPEAATSRLKSMEASMSIDPDGGLTNRDDPIFRPENNSCLDNLLHLQGRSKY
jgi:hypothetical protein